MESTNQLMNIAIMLFVVVSMYAIFKSFFELLFKGVLSLVAVVMIYIFIVFAGNVINSDYGTSAQQQATEKPSKPLEETMDHERSSNPLVNPEEPWNENYTVNPPQTPSAEEKSSVWVPKGGNTTPPEYSQENYVERGRIQSPSPQWIPDHPVHIYSDCIGKPIRDRSYILMVEIFSNLKEARQKVKQLKRLGFASADCFDAACYDSALGTSGYVVRIERACRTLASIQKKQKAAIAAFDQKGLVAPILRIVRVFSSVPADNQGQPEKSV